jgi:exodeoxyribonuclease VII small subunit
MTKSDKSLRQLIDEFEKIVNSFQESELDIEVAITKFEAGAKLAEQIKKRLAEAKNQIEIVKKRFDS